MIDDPDNPLISPCSCIGFQKFIHLECLRQWINSKLEVRASPGGGSMISLKHAKCEICLKPLPLKIKILGKELPLIDIHRPIAHTPRYAVFETIEIGKRCDKCIHTVPFAEHPQAPPEEGQEGQEHEPIQELKQIVSTSDPGSRKALPHAHSGHFNQPRARAARGEAGAFVSERPAL